MAKQLRLEFAGALYCVAARGAERRAIALVTGKDDRLALLTLECHLTGTAARFYDLLALDPKYRFANQKHVRRHVSFTWV